jgi:multiple sugar transport system substrate-binding protein
LIGCHGTEKAKESMGEYATSAFEIPDNFDMSKKYSISFVAKSDSNERQTKIYQKAIADFNKIYPNIEISLQIETDYGRIYRNVITNIQTATTPNICITYPDHVATYLTGENVVVSLDELMSDERYGFGGEYVLFDSPTKEEVIPKFLEECKINGKYYALPYMRSTEACYVNKTFVEALGYELPEILTWDFVFEVSHAAMQKNTDGTYKLNGQDVLIPCIYKSTDNMMIQMLMQKGGEYSNDSGDILIFNDTTTEILKDIYGAADDLSFSTFKISSYPGDYLNCGQCIFAIDSTAGATWIGTNAPNMDIKDESTIVNFETVVLPIPQYNPNEPVMISQGPSMCLFNKDDPGEVIASWLFMQYLLTNEIQIEYAATEGYVPVTSKAQNSSEYVDYLSRSGEDNDRYYSIKIDATKLMLDNIERTFITPVFNGSASLRNAAGQMIEETVKYAHKNDVFSSEKERDARVDANINVVYEKMVSLYNLDRELGTLSTGAIALLLGVGAIDVTLIVYFCVHLVKKRRSKNKK